MATLVTTSVVTMVGAAGAPCMYFDFEVLPPPEPEIERLRKELNIAVNGECELTWTKDRPGSREKGDLLLPGS